jgi:surfeit locus 1 family protein
VLPAAIATGVALAILIALGVWQLQRREWKLGILAAIDRAESGPPMALGRDPPAFAKVFVTGTLLPARALYGIEVRDQLGGQPREGAQLVGMVARPGAPDVVVDLGWVPIDDGAPDPLRPAAARSITVTGYVRAPDHPNWLSARDDPAARRFYTLDPRAIGAALGERDVAPFTLVALGKAAWPGGPVPAEALPRPPNNHLQYAFTWFGLGATLLWVFGSWVKRSRC